MFVRLTVVPLCRTLTSVALADILFRTPFCSNAGNSRCSAHSARQTLDWVLVLSRAVLKDTGLCHLAPAPLLLCQPGQS